MINNLPTEANILIYIFTKKIILKIRNKDLIFMIKKMAIIVFLEQ
jgi:hypothetical protein